MIWMFPEQGAEQLRIKPALLMMMRWFCTGRFYPVLPNGPMCLELVEKHRQGLCAC